MTKRHTIPDAFPTLHERDYYNRKVARGDLFRRVAQAQNYLWSKQGRIHGMSAYEGSNCTCYDVNVHQGGIPDYASVPAGHIAVPLASIFIPDNPGPTRSVDVLAQFGISGTAGFGFIVSAGVYELDGTFTGVHADTTITSTATTEATVTVPVPHGRPCQIVLWGSYYHTGGGTEYATFYYVRAKFTDPTTNDLFGSPVVPLWHIIQPAAGLSDGDAVSAPLMRTLIRNTLALWSRQWIIANCYLSDQLNNGNGAYRFTPGQGCTHFDVTIYGYMFNASSVGTLTVTFTGGTTTTISHTIPATVGYSTFATTIAASSNITNMNLHWSGPNPGTTGDWGFNVYGVTVVEHGADPGIAIPTAYQPIDEELFTADDLIDTTSILNKLLANDIWLMANRPRVLVSDWTHRTLKRIEQDDALGIPPEWDWTRGPDGAAHATFGDDPGSEWVYGLTGRLANITICGDNTTVDGSGSTAHDDQDGEGKYPDGLCNSWSASDTSFDINKALWPKNMVFRRQGRRLARFEITQPISDRSGASPPTVHNLVPGARIQTWVRGCRVGTALMVGFFYQNDSGGGPAKIVYERPVRGPGPENPFFAGWGTYDIDYNSVSSGQLQLRPDLRGTTIAVGASADDQTFADLSPQWLGPAVEVQPASPPTTLTIRGRLLSRAGSNLRQGSDSLEGTVFEMELKSALVMDAPLTQDLLDALDP